MVDRAHIGRSLPAYNVTVEKGRLRFFAQAIGERNPVFTDEQAASAAGYRSLPIPPTFLFSLENEVPDCFAWLTEMGVDMRRVLHGEQRFTYHGAVCAGDVIRFAARIADIYEKKNGALEFIVRETAVTLQDTLVAELRTVIVVRHG